MTQLTAVRGLAAIARHHGLSLQPEYIAHEFSLADEEPEPVQLARIARAVGLRADFLTVEWKELLVLRAVFPFMARLKDGGYLLVAGLTNVDTVQCLAVLNPSSATASILPINQAQFEDQCSGEILLLKRNFRAVDEDQPFGLKWFLPLLLRHKAVFRDIALATLLLNFVSLGTPLFTQLVLDKVLVHENLSTLWVLTAGVAILIVFEMAVFYIRQFLLISATNKVDMRLARNVFSHLLGLPVDYFERQAAGLIARQVQQIQQIRNFLTGSLFFTVLESVSFFVFLPILFGYSFKLTLVVLLMAGLMAGVIFVLLAPFKRRLDRLSGAESQKQAMLVESIHGMRTIKSLALEPRQRKAWDQRNADTVTLNFSVMNISLLGNTLTQMLQRMLSVVVIVLGCLEVFDRNMTVGGLIAFQMLAGRVVGPLVQIVSLIHEFQQTAISVEMLADVMNYPPERKSGGGLRAPIRGAISFDGVMFSYPGSDSPALSDVSFSIQPGEVVGVVGKSGSGKSTFAKLLQGLYKTQGGVIRYDETDLREIDLSHLRQNIGVVLQENFLFKGSIKDNIAITRPNASFEEIVFAAKTAGADEFIERLKHGYDTLLEEGASNLSGGQRQRIAIARALLTRPKVLILDEAASALDPDSEVIFMNNLKQIARGRTVVIISHRLSTLVGCNKIAYFEQGRIVDSAPHEELLVRCKGYQHLWRQQNLHT